MASRARTISSRSRTGRPCRTSPWASPPSTIRRARPAKSSSPARCSAPASSSRRAPIRRARSSTAPRSPGRYALIDSYEDALSHVRRLRHRGRAFDQELQPAAPQPAPAGRRRGPRREHPGRARGRLALPDGHHADPGRQFDGRAQHPAAALLRGRGQPLFADPGRLQSDPGGHLWRPRRRSLLVAGRAGLAASPADPPHAAGELAGRVRATTAPADQFVDQYSAREVAPARRARRAGRDRRPRPAAGHGRALGIVVPRPRRRDPGRGAALRHRRSAPASTASPISARSSPASSPTSSSSTPIRPRTSAIPTISTW